LSISLGIDTGGTFTDAVPFDPDRGVLAAAKRLTTGGREGRVSGAAIRSAHPTQLDHLQIG